MKYQAALVRLCLERMCPALSLPYKQDVDKLEQETVKLRNIYPMERS